MLNFVNTYPEFEIVEHDIVELRERRAGYGCCRWRGHLSVV